MKQKKFYSAIVLLLVTALLVTACGNNGTNSNSSSANNNSSSASNNSAGEQTETSVPAALLEKGDVKIKVIRYIGGDDHTAQFLAGAKQEGEALGFQVETFSANGNRLQFHDALQQAANEDLDAVIISHGDDAATIEEVQALRDKGIEVVAFDSIDGLTEIAGVTSTSQNDESLAKLALDDLVAETGGEARILYLWVDGFPPMVRRNAVYQEVLAANPGIVELDRFGIASDNTSVDTQNAVAALLSKYPKGEIDAIFATWDAFAIGAHRALVEANRSEIKIYGIDVSNPDLAAIQEENSSWVSTAAVDPKLIGAVTVRLAAKKLAGEETPSTYNLDASLIKQSDLKSAGETVKMDTLSNIIPGWGTSDAFLEDWMEELKAK